MFQRMPEGTLNRQQTETVVAAIKLVVIKVGDTVSFYSASHWLQEIQITDTKCECQFVNSDDSGIAAADFKTANVLLAETRDIGQLLLSQTALLPDPLDIVSNQSAHIHALRSADYIF